MRCEVEEAWKKLSEMGIDVSYLKGCDLTDSDAIELSDTLESLIAEYREARMCKQVRIESDMTG